MELFLFVCLCVFFPSHLLEPSSSSSPSSSSNKKPKQALDKLLLDSSDIWLSSSFFFFFFGDSQNLQKENLGVKFFFKLWILKVSFGSFDMKERMPELLSE